MKAKMVGKRPLRLLVPAFVRSGEVIYNAVVTLAGDSVSRVERFGGESAGVRQIAGILALGGPGAPPAPRAADVLQAARQLQQSATPGDTLWHIDVAARTVRKFDHDRFKI